MVGKRRDLLIRSFPAVTKDKQHDRRRAPDVPFVDSKIFGVAAARLPYSKGLQLSAAWGLAASIGVKPSDLCKEPCEANRR